MSVENKKMRGEGERSYPWFIRKRSYLFFLPLLLGVISAAVISSQYYHYREIIHRRQEENRASAQMLSALILQHQKAALGIVQSYANRPALVQAAREKDPSQALPHLVSLTEKNPELDGAVQCTVSLSRLISRAEPDPGRKVTLLDQAGNIISSNRFPHREDVTPYPIPRVIEEVQKGETGSIEFADPLERGRIKYATVTPLGGLGWSVIVEKGRREVLQEYFLHFLQTAILYFLGFVLLLLGLLYLRKRYTHRVTEMLLRSQMELGESERRYRSLLENARMIAVGLDGEGKITFANPCLLEITGYSLEEVKGQSWFDTFLPGKVKEEIQAVFSNIVEKGFSPHYENPIRTKSGEERLIAWNNTLLKDTRGRTIGTMSLGEDITDRRWAEEALKESEARARKAARENALLAEIGRTVGSTLNIEEIYEQFAGVARGLIPHDRAIISLIEEGAGQNLVAHTSGEDITERRTGAIYPLKGSVNEWMLKSRTGLVFAGGREERIAFEARCPSLIPLFRGGIQSYLAVPLFFRNRVFGGLHFSSKDAAIYGDDHLRLAGQVAAMISGAISNAQLYRVQKKGEEQILASLREKEILLKEVHHRVKNNLQVVSSLLNLQSRKTQDLQLLEIFRESQNRVRSLALVHEKLYRSPDLARVDFREYIRNMAASLFSSYQTLARGVSLEVDAEEVYLGVDLATPCGLILNELVSNALKHAFPGGRRGKISIVFHRREKRQYVMRVRDDGIGCPPEMDISRTETLGLQLVDTLTKQLAGSLELNREGGTEFSLTFGDGDPAGGKHG